MVATHGAQTLLARHCLVIQLRESTPRQSSEPTFCSKDGGKTWEDVDKGRLPNVPHHAVVIRPDEPKTVYVANDAGVFVSHDSGNTWMNMTRNLPNVMVVDLVLQEKDRTLSAATYGRSLWRTRI